MEVIRVIGRYGGSKRMLTSSVCAPLLEDIEVATANVSKFSNIRPQRLTGEQGRRLPKPTLSK